MAEGEGVIDATVTEFRAHPWIIGGSVLALVGLIWYVSAGKHGTAVQQFTYQSGPTAAQIEANAAIGIQQGINQTAISQAQIAAGVTGNYFDYLTQNSANQTAVLNNAITTNAETSQFTTASNERIAGNTNAMNLTLGLGAESADVTKAGYAMTTTLGVANTGAASADYIAGLGAQTQQLGIASTERISDQQIAASQNATNLAAGLDAAWMPVAGFQAVRGMPVNFP